MANIYQKYWLPCFHCVCCFLSEAAAEMNPPKKTADSSVFIGLCYSNYHFVFQVLCVTTAAV